MLSAKEVNIIQVDIDIPFIQILVKMSARSSDRSQETGKRIDVVSHSNYDAEALTMYSIIVSTSRLHTDNDYPSVEPDGISICIYEKAWVLHLHIHDVLVELLLHTCKKQHFQIKMILLCYSYDISFSIKPFCTHSMLVLQM